MHQPSNESMARQFLEFIGNIVHTGNANPLYYQADNIEVALLG